MVLSTRIIPAAGNGESCLGLVFRPFSNSHQYRFKIRLRLVDISAFSGPNKVFLLLFQLYNNELL